MSKGGVTSWTAQAAMRHSKIDLTKNVYTDSVLLDVRDALDMLPALPLEAGSDQAEAVMTGTDASPLAPPLAPTWCKRATRLSKLTKRTPMDRRPKRASRLPLVPTWT
jgi:hypothetical protein